MIPRPRSLFPRWELLLILACIGVIALILTSCGVPEVRPPGEATACVPGDGGVANALARIAVLSAWAGGIGLTLCLIALWFVPNKWTVAKLAAACIALIVSGQVVAFIGRHIGLITGIGVGVAVLALGVVAWRHIGKIERLIGKDINGNGKVG